MNIKTVADRSTEERGDAALVALIGGTVIDGTGAAPIDGGVVLIDGQRIRAVGGPSTPIPQQAKQVRIPGKFIIPGLMDPCVALVPFWAPALLQYEGRYHEVAVEAAQLSLKSGVTTVFANNGPRDPLIKARDSIKDGRASGARIFLCGSWMGCGGPFSPHLLEHSKENVGEDSIKRKMGSVTSAVDPDFKARVNALWEVNIGESLARMSLDEARHEVRQYVQSGIDYVTYLVNSHRYGTYCQIALSPRVQRMIVEEAHRAGLPALGTFATTEEGVHLALETRPDSLYQTSWSSSPLSAAIVKRLAQSGIFLHMGTLPADELDWYRRQPPSVLWPGFLKLVETKQADNSAIVAAGTQVVSAGVNTLIHADERKLLDSAGPPGSFPGIGVGHVTNLQGLQDSGMNPMDLLMAVTRNVARAYKVDKDVGTLEPGKLADLVVLDRSPLDGPENYRAIHLVMKDGKVVDRDALPTQRLWTAPLDGHV